MFTIKPLKPADWGRLILPGNRVFIGSNAACPYGLVESLLSQAADFRDVEIVHILTLGDEPWTKAEYQENFKVNALFLGRHTREAVRQGIADYTPCFLSEIPSLFTGGILPIDVALVMVSPPDAHGYCSFGVAVDVVAAACRSARHVVAQINPSMPRTFGQSFIHVSQITACLELDQPIPELPRPKLDDITLRIGHYVSMLVEDGSTLQMGIGKIPDAVLSYLGKRKDLGIHTEMFSDGVIDLINSGVINNTRKRLHPGKSVVSFCMGTRRLYDFVHENPHVEFHPSEYTNNPAIIAQNDRVVAINSAIEVDLTGQVVADSLGYSFYSGIGGQVDFIRGAAMSLGGKPIIALPATAKNGTVSRIVPYLTEGSGVVTSRGDVHYVVTEFGIATLRGKSVRERAMELIQVAHPDFREWLLAKVREHYWVPVYHTFNSGVVQEIGEVEMIPLTFKGSEYFLRPLHPSDERRVQLLFYSHNKETLAQLYRHAPSRMSRPKAYALANVDQKVDLALCIIERQGPREVIHAIGRYQYITADNSAELEFVVRENKRGMGMASALLEQILRIAKVRRLHHLNAQVTTANGSMRHLLEKRGFIQVRLQGKELFLVHELREEAGNDQLTKTADGDAPKPEAKSKKSRKSPKE